MSSVLQLLHNWHLISHVGIWLWTIESHRKRKLCWRQQPHSQSFPCLSAVSVLCPLNTQLLPFYFVCVVFSSCLNVPLYSNQHLYLLPIPALSYFCSFTGSSLWQWRFYKMIRGLDDLSGPPLLTSFITKFSFEFGSSAVTCGPSEKAWLCNCILFISLSMALPFVHAKICRNMYTQFRQKPFTRPEDVSAWILTPKSSLSCQFHVAYKHKMPIAESWK